MANIQPLGDRVLLELCETKELEELAMKMGEALYAQQAAQGQPGAGTPPPQDGGAKPADDTIVDAEVVD